MLRKTVIGALLAGALAAPASAAARGQLLMPGVVYSRQVEFTPHGPVVVNVVSAPRPTGLYGLRTVLSNNAIQGRERLTAMEKDVSGSATVVGVNGDAFGADGHPNGLLLRGGALDATPNGRRSSVGIDAAGKLRVDRVSLAGTWKGTGQRRPLVLNEPASKQTTLYTPAWGATTPAEQNVVEAVLSPVPATSSNSSLSAPVVQLVQGGGQAIPPGGAVLVARGDAAALTAEAPAGTTLNLRLNLSPSWSDVRDGLGGGPVLVRDGRPVFRSFELFTTAQLAARGPRTGVGQTADGRILLVAVDGRQPGYSTGLTNFELALTLMRLGAVSASALDSGTSSALAFDGKLLDRPSDRTGERAVADALLLSYAGVYAPPPSAGTLSSSETEALSYKLVRASTVSAVLSGPNGVAVALDSGRRAPGSYRFDWNGKLADGSAAPAGRWTFSVAADDDQGRHSAADRSFTLARPSRR